MIRVLCRCDFSTNLKETILQMIKASTQLGIGVTSEFNGIEIRVDSDSVVNQIIEKYEADLAFQSEQEKIKTSTSLIERVENLEKLYNIPPKGEANLIAGENLDEGDMTMMGEDGKVVKSTNQPAVVEEPKDEMWSWDESDKGSWYNDYYSTREEAIEAGKAEAGNDFWIGQKVFIWETDFHVNFGREDVVAQVYEMFDDAPGYYPEMSEEEEKAMQLELDTVLARHLPRPNFHRIDYLEKISRKPIKQLIEKMPDQIKYYAEIVHDDGSGYAYISFQVFDSEQELLDAFLFDTDTINGELKRIPNCRVFFKGTEIEFVQHIADSYKLDGKELEEKNENGG